MIEAEFAEILARGYELRNVEYKGPGLRSDKPFRARVARAVLGMANLRDGGSVFLGVADVSGQPRVVGLDAAELASWSTYDDVATALGEYAQPSVSFDLETFTFQGSNLVRVKVAEFDEVPILCAQEAHDDRQQQILRRGALYVRSRRRRETAEVPTQDEMREIIDLAAEKRMRRYIEMAGAAGASVLQATTDVTRYEEELDELS